MYNKLKLTKKIDCFAQENDHWKVSAKVSSAGLVIAVLTSGDIYPIFLVGFFYSNASNKVLFNLVKSNNSSFR